MQKKELIVIENTIKTEYLDAIELNIDLIINNGKVLNEKTVFFEAIKTLVDLQKNNVDAGEFFQSFLDTTIAIAQGDFSNQMQTMETSNPLATNVTLAMNMLIQELEYYSTRKCYLDGVLDFISDAAIIIKLDGKMHSMNKEAEKLTGFTLKELLNVNVTKLFGTQKAIDLGLKATKLEPAKISIFNKKKDIVPVNFYIETLHESRSERLENQGFIIILTKQILKRRKTAI